MMDSTVTKRSKFSNMTKAHLLCPLKCCYCTRRFYSVGSYHSHVKSHEKRYHKFWFAGKKTVSPDGATSEPDQCPDSNPSNEKLEKELDDLKKTRMCVYLVYPPGRLCECNKENRGSKMPCSCEFTYKRVVYNSIQQMHQSLLNGIGYTCDQCKKHVIQQDLSSLKNNQNRNSSICPQCGDCFARYDDFQKHYQVCSGFSGVTCGASGNIVDGVKNSDFQCIVCGHFCSDDVSLNDHIKSHAEATTISDDPADKVSVIWKDRVDHDPVRKVQTLENLVAKDPITTGKHVECTTCSSASKSVCQNQPKPSLVNVMQAGLVLPQVMFECNTCKMKFVSMAALQNHQALHSVSFVKIAPAGIRPHYPLLATSKKNEKSNLALQSGLYGYVAIAPCKRQLMAAVQKRKRGRPRGTKGKCQIILPTSISLAPAGVLSRRQSGGNQNISNLKSLPTEIQTGDNSASSADHLYSILQFHKNKWKCEECSKTFKSRDDLRLHIREKHRQGSVFRGKDWRCDICECVFPSRDKWKAHEKVHKVTKRKWLCAHCGFHFDKEQYLISHNKEKHPNAVIPNMEFKLTSEFVNIPFSAFSRQSKRSKGPDRENKVVSSRGSKLQAGENANQKISDEENQNQTDVPSDALLDGNKSLQEEIIDGSVIEVADIHKGKWKCIECPNRFKSRDNMRLHVRLKHRGGLKVRGKEWRCLICKVLLPTRDKWKAHGRLHKGEKKGACTGCGIYFETRQKFATHLNEIHGMSSIDEEHSYMQVEEEKTKEINDRGVWPCNSCSLTFESKKELREHSVGKHRDGERIVDDFWPCIECSSSFRGFSYLSVHVKLNHPESSSKIWTCSTCSQTLETSDKLQKHKREHLVPSKVSISRWVCSECGEIFDTRDELRLHRRDHLRHVHQLKCHSCGWLYGSIEELRIHAEDHVVDFEKLKCGKCKDTDFSTLNDLKTHLKTHDDLCQLCGLQFSALHNREKHTKVCVLEGASKDLPDKTKCPECGEEFKKSVQFRLHVARHAMKRERMKCKMCGETFGSRKETEQHKEMHKTDCHMCMKRFPTSEELTAHLAIHVSCKFCDKKFESYSSCKRHMESYCHQALAEAGLLPRRKFPSIPAGRKMKPLKKAQKCECYCDQCGKKFNTKEAMKNHRIIHFRCKFSTATKCPDCDLVFNYATQLRMHKQKVHWPEKPFACVYCKVRFKTSSELHAHEDEHTVDKPHSCPMCTRKFKDKTAVYYHINTHTGVKPYKCKYCAKTFSQPGQRKTHERRHEGHRPYKCSVCDRTYIYGTSLKIHLQTHVRKGELDKLPDVIHSEELQLAQKARNEAIKAAKRERVRLAKEAKDKARLNASVGEPVEDILLPVLEVVTQNILASGTSENTLAQEVDKSTEKTALMPANIQGNFVPTRSPEDQVYESIIVQMQSMGAHVIDNGAAVTWSQTRLSPDPSQCQAVDGAEVMVQLQHQDNSTSIIDGANVQQMQGEQGAESAAATVLYSMTQR